MDAETFRARFAGLLEEAAATDAGQLAAAGVEWVRAQLEAEHRELVAEAQTTTGP